jgi:hypothetical protein
MTKRTMMKWYEIFSAADAYIVGFVLDGALYMVEMTRIAPRFLNVEEASRNQGTNLRLRLKRAQKEALAKKAICLGDADVLTTGKYNKGENFEKVVTEYFGQEWVKDTVPFYVQGDICLDGKEVQIKLDTATLANEKMLNKLKRG